MITRSTTLFCNNAVRPNEGNDSRIEDRASLPNQNRTIQWLQSIFEMKYIKKMRPKIQNFPLRVRHSLLSLARYRNSRESLDINDEIDFCVLLKCETSWLAGWFEAVVSMWIMDDLSWHLRYYNYSFLVYIMFGVFLVGFYVTIYCTRMPTNRFPNLR